MVGLPRDAEQAGHDAPDLAGRFGGVGLQEAVMLRDVAPRDVGLCITLDRDLGTVLEQPGRVAPRRPGGGQHGHDRFLAGCGPPVRGRRMGEETVGPGLAGLAEENNRKNGENPPSPTMYRQTYAPLRPATCLSRVPRRPMVENIVIKIIIMQVF